MAFALSTAPTAGVGTVSLTRDSFAVTGVGTNFTSPSLVGRIILVNGFNSLVASVQSATALTLSRAPTQSLTGESFTHAANGLAVNQSGTDTSMSGLTGIEGIGKSVAGNQTIYFMGAIRLNFTGAAAVCSYNANTESLVWDSSTAPEVTINAGRTLTITGARTDGTYTANFYPRAMGWARLGSDFLPGDSPLIINGTLNATGVWFDGSTTEQLTATCNVTDCKWSNTLLTANFRLNSASISIDGLALYGSNLTLITVPAKLDGLKFYNSTYVPVSLSATTPTTPRTYENWDFQGALPLVNNFGGNANYTEFVNLGNWDGFRLASNASLSLAIRFTKRVILTVTDSANATVSDAVIYRLDTNNGNRSTYYTTDEHFIQTTVAGAATGKILAQVGRFPNGAVYNSTVYTATMDYRNAANSGTGADTLYFASYGHLLAERSINTKGNNTLSIEQTLFTDSNVTLSRTAAIAKLASSFTVDSVTKTVTVTANSTYDDLYDAMKAHKCTAIANNLATPVRGNTLIVTPSGTQLTGYTGWTLVVNTGITLSSGAKFTYVYFPTVTINGTGRITGIYGTTAGVSTVLELRDISNGAAYIIANASTSATILYGTNATGSTQTYTAYFPPGSAGTNVYVARQLYGKQFTYEVITLATGGMWYTFVDVEDVGITVTNRATVAAYTTLENSAKFYDRYAILRETEAVIKLGEVVIRSGSDILLGYYSHVINKDAASVISVSGTTITSKSVSYDASTKFDNEISNNGTITANTTELININIEDINGNSSVTILGGDDLGYQLWKVPSSLPVGGDYTTGTLLSTAVGKGGKYRFIGVTGYDIIGVDISSNVVRRCSMGKGIYSLSFYVGNQIQLADDAPQLVELINSIGAMQLQVDGMPADVWAEAIEAGYTATQVMRIMAAVLAGKVSGAGTGTETFKGIDGTTDRVISSPTEEGNRTGVILNGS